MKPKPRAESDGAKVLFVRIPTEQHRQLRLLAAKRDVRVADLVRDALTAYLKKEA